MSSKDYLESIQKFYEERLHYQLKPKTRQCKGCKNNKQFIEKEGKLIYSCGSKAGKCGPQMIIDLAKYIHYTDMKHDTTTLINETLDITQFDDIYSQGEIQKQTEFIKGNAQLYKKCKKPFSNQNELKSREKLIIKTHQNRIKLKKEQSLLLEKIKKEEDKIKKNNFRKEYIHINQQMKENYEQLCESDKPLNPFLVIEAGKVTHA